MAVAGCDRGDARGLINLSGRDRFCVGGRAPEHRLIGRA